ncbi:hypothetical protein B0H19DRAFT_1317303 [Mycena capillaripes]|nr:hypothetical protein B0H19DRAFT_1317303 [Mycena capillaripes]
MASVGAIPHKGHEPTVMAIAPSLEEAFGESRRCVSFRKSWQKLQLTLNRMSNFDMIAGTSTGGLIAITLGRLQMIIGECAEEYETLSKEVFGAGNLITRGAKLIKKRLRDENAKMYDKDAKYPGNYGDWHIWQAARATSAAPHYFDAIEINGVTLADDTITPLPNSYGRRPSVSGRFMPSNASCPLAPAWFPTQGSAREGDGHREQELHPEPPRYLHLLYHRFNFGVGFGKGGKIKFVKPGYNVHPWSKGAQVEDDWNETIAMEDWRRWGNI